MSGTSFLALLILVLWGIWYLLRDKKGKRPTGSSLPTGLAPRPRTKTQPADANLSARSTTLESSAVQRRSPVPSRLPAGPFVSPPPEGLTPLADLIADKTPLVFLTGRAGTGKTYAVKWLAEAYTQPTAVVAPTGIAALNVGGSTINSFFGAPWTPIRTDHEVRGLRSRHVLTKLALLIVDEVSMVRPDLLHYVDRSLQKHRRCDLPFGGVPVLLVGDPFQLPPVVRAEGENGADGQFLDATFGGSTFPFTPAVKQLGLKTIELKKVWRQEDADFLAALDAVREGRGLEQALDYLNRRVGENSSDSIVLCATRGLADEINEQKLRELPEPEETFTARVSGRVTDSEKRNFQSPEVLRLRAGTHVMFTQNDPGGRWVNGTLGEVTRLRDREVRVEINQSEVTVDEATWEIRRLTWDSTTEELAVRVVGSYVQLPLMHAWATTVHKAQGLTLERVHLNLDSPGWCHGLVYTALSRCRTFEGLSLQRPLRHADVSVDARSWEWYRAVVGPSGQ
jgi:ATP-dependent DNA helicase PIF1